MLQSLSFRKKMLTLPFVAGAGFALVLLAALALGTRSQTALERIERGHYPAVELARDASDLLEQIQRQLRDAVSLQDEEELARADALRDRLLEQLASGQANRVLDAKHTRTLEREIESYYELARDTSRRLLHGSLDEGLTARLETLRARYLAIRATLEADSIRSQEAIRSGFLNARSAQYRLTLTVVVVATLCMLAMLMTARAVARGVTRPVAEAIRLTRALSQGDLTTAVDPVLLLQAAEGPDDEVQNLLRVLVDMTERLRELVGRVRVHTKGVTALAATLHDSSEEMTASMGDQRLAVGEATRSISLVAESVTEVNESVEAVSTLARRASGELAGIDRSFNGMIDLIDQQSAKLDEAAAAAVETSSSSGQVATAADSLNQSADSSSRSLQALLHSVRGVAKSAGHARDLAREMRTRAENGMHKVEQTRASMDDIHANYRQIDAIIGALSEKSSAIGAINKVVEGVLAQTHLLALNATIISAQAGEQGRAFAVVAQQIGNMADRTTESTRQIRELIEDVQKQVEEAVDAMAGGGRRIELGVSRSHEAGELLSEIGQSAESCSEKVDRIVEATSVQAEDIDASSESVKQLRDVASQLEDATQEQAKANAQIRDAMEELRDLGHRIAKVGHDQRSGSQAVTSAVDDVAERIGQIAQASTEQRESGGHIGHAVQVFEGAVSKSAERAELVRAAVRDLLERSEELEAEVRRFGA